MATDNNNQTSIRWKNNPSIYPPVEEVAKALQDEGKSVKVKQKGREVNVYKYPVLDKLATKIATSIQRVINPEGLTKNITRARQPLLKELVLGRKHMDLSEVNPFFIPFGKNNKVFLLADSPVHCGLDLAIDAFQDFVEHQVKQKNSARTSNDGLRLGCILLDAKYRGSVAGILSKKKDRKKSDVPGDPNTHFFELILTEAFSNIDYVVSPPSACYYDDFPEEEKGSWDPNHHDIFEHTRSGEWLKATWEEYLRPKYKKALDKWNKDTGGGDGSPVSFIDFCGGDRWLVWLFCKDREANFLLANSAGGRMPRHLQVEAGFEEEIDSSVTVSDVSNSAATKRKNSIEAELEENKKHRQELKAAVDRVMNYFDSKEDRELASSMDTYINQVAGYSQMINDTGILETMSPDSKETYIDCLRRQRKNVLDKMKQDNKESNEDENSS